MSCEKIVTVTGRYGGIPGSKNHCTVKLSRREHCLELIGFSLAWGMLAVADCRNLQVAKIVLECQLVGSSRTHGLLVGHNVRR